MSLYVRGHVVVQVRGIAIHSFFTKMPARTSAIFWYVLLLTVVPAINNYWAFLAFAPGPGSLFEPTWDTAYSALCIMIVLLFLWLGKQRRLVFGAFVLTLLALNLHADEPSLDRILSFVAYVALLGIVLEFYRQNIPLYNELKASGVSVGRILLKASLLWSPMLLFVFIGFALNYLIIDSTRSALYASPFIDRYCVIQGGPDRPLIPCTNLNSVLRRDQLDHLSDKENIALHVERIFFLRKKATLEEISSRPLDQWNDRGAVLQELSRIERNLRPADMLGLEPPPVQTAPNYRRDPQIQGLREQLNVVNAKLKRRPRPLFGFIPLKKREYSALEAEKRRLLKALRSREAVLRKQERERKQQEQKKDPADFKVKAYRNVLYRDLARINPAREFRGLRTGFPGQLKRKVPPTEIRASLKVAVVRFMSSAEGKTKNAIIARLGRSPDLAYDIGVARRLCRLKDSGNGAGSEFLFECPTAAKENWALEPLSFRKSVDLSILRWHERSERELERGLIESRLAASRTAGDVKRANERLWAPDVIPPNIGFEEKRCGLNPGCHLSNWAKQAAEDAYMDARADLKARSMSAVRTRANAAASGLNEQIDSVRSELYEALDELRRGLDSAVEEIARGGAVASALLQLWLLLVIIKSVLYVIATEVFNVKSNPVIGLESQSDAEGAYTRSTNIQIPESFETAMQTATVGINQGKRTVIPQPFRAMFARIIRGKWMLNKGTHAENATMRFTQPGGRVGIDWQMRDGEEVVFRYGDLLGFSENLELRTTISLRLSTLLFGRYVYHSARCVNGPGRLLLSVKGDVEAEQDKVETFPLERLIAWNMHTKFRVTDERTLAAVFKDGFTIRRVRQGPERNGLVLVGAPMSSEPLFQGTMRFVKTFLMPI